MSLGGTITPPKREREKSLTRLLEDLIHAARARGNPIQVIRMNPTVHELFVRDITMFLGNEVKDLNKFEGVEIIVNMQCVGLELLFKSAVEAQQLLQKQEGTKIGAGA